MIKYKVIYVDDEDSLLEIGKAFMERDPEIKVFTFNSPREVLAIIMEDSSYDIVISDYQMPDIDGIELLKCVRKSRNKDIPFIIFTGKGREEVVIEAINHGASFYIQKGGDLESQYAELIHKTKQAVSKDRMRKGVEEFQKMTSMAIDKNMSLNDILIFALKSMHELIFVDYSCIMTIDSSRCSPVVDYGSGDISLFEQHPLYREIGDMVISEKKNHILFKMPGGEDQSKAFNSGLVLPIKYGDEILGMFYAFSSSTDFFSKDKVPVIALVRNMIAISMVLSRQSHHF